MPVVMPPKHENCLNALGEVIRNMISKKPPSGHGWWTTKKKLTCEADFIDDVSNVFN